MTNTWLSVRSSVVLFIFIMMGLGQHSTTANMDEVKALLSQMNADLQSVKTQLQETRQELKNEMQSYEEKLQNTRQQLKNEMHDKLKRDLQAVDTKLQNTRQQLKNDIESTEMKLQNKHDKLERDLQTADTKLQNSHGKLKRDLQAADTKLQKTRQELRADLESSDTKLQRTCRELRTDLGFAETELRKLRHDIRSAETNQSNTIRRLLRRIPRTLPDRPVRRSISALGWPKVYSPGETLIYYWFVHNNYANVMNPRNGEFTVPHTGIYFVSFYGEVGPTSPTKKNVFASIVVGIDEVAYVYAAYDDHYESGSMQVVRHIGKGTPVFVRNGKRFSVKWEGFGISVVFITE